MSLAPLSPPQQPAAVMAVRRSQPAMDAAHSCAHHKPSALLQKLRRSLLDFAEVVRNLRRRQHPAQKKKAATQSL